jgi:4-hydroxythreonine-4-phosphate dehydrogenase
MVELGTPTEESTKMAIDSLEAATEALLKGKLMFWLQHLSTKMKW